MTTTALMIPVEAPPSATDIKRALITYDRVLIVDPGDREMMPPQCIQEAALPGRPGFYNSGMSGRPLGKLPDYDSEFQRTLEGFKPALAQGILSVGSTFTYMQPPAAGQLTAAIGSFGTGDYLPEPSVVLSVYRSLCRDQAVLRLAIQDDELLRLPSDRLAGLAHSGIADAAFMGDGGLPLIENVAGGGERAHSLTMIARGRIGSIVKGAAYCDLASMVPIFAAQGYCAVLDKLAMKLRESLVALYPDQFWSRRARILDVVQNESIDTAALDRMSIDDVLRLRTVAWGNSEAAREALFKSLTALNDDIPETADFAREAVKRIREYRHKVEDVARERRALHWTMAAEVAAGLSSVGIAAAGSAALVHPPLGELAAILAFDSWLALRLSKTGASLDKIKLEEQRLSRRPELGLYNYYRGLEGSIRR